MTNRPLKAGDRVTMPNDVAATVLGASGWIVEGALALGDDGVTYAPGLVAVTVLTPPTQSTTEGEQI